MSSPTYKFYPNKDSYGGDLGQVHKSRAREECDKLTGCAGYNTNGWLKKTIGPIPTTTWGGSGDGLYVKN